MDRGQETEEIVDHPVAGAGVGGVTGYVGCRAGNRLEADTGCVHRSAAL